MIPRQTDLEVESGVISSPIRRSVQKHSTSNFMKEFNAEEGKAGVKLNLVQLPNLNKLAQLIRHD
ncbi:MAG: hypothetical protein ACREAS_06890 [Nitrososphaera sp.]